MITRESRCCDSSHCWFLLINIHVFVKRLHGHIDSHPKQHIILYFTQDKDNKILSCFLLIHGNIINLRVKQNLDVHHPYPSNLQNNPTTIYSQHSVCILTAILWMFYELCHHYDHFSLVLHKYGSPTIAVHIFIYSQ